MGTFCTAALDESTRDVHSYAEPKKISIRHIDFDIDVSFHEKILKGTVTLRVERLNGDLRTPLVLDSRDLSIDRVELLHPNGAPAEADYHFGDTDPILGKALVIDVPSRLSQVRIAYRTSPEASGLQWLEPEQTSGKRFPFLFTQSQEIHARSWLPLQDTPAVRFTFTGRVRTPVELFAVMGAENNPHAPRNGIYEFQMDQPIPSYLLALAVGDIHFSPTGYRTGVYAERAVLDAAASEFDDAENLLKAAERLYGAYRWERYDLLVLPPSFPFGGMENPRLTFVSPTLITGDKGLVALLAHEMAHSWAGNLVTNATWSDFWLNEGFTTYIERRIQEEVYGLERAEIEMVLGRQKLEEDLERLDKRDQILHIDLSGRDPDEGATEVPYEKGALLLVLLEHLFGKKEFDRYLRNYFDHFAFQSITTKQAIDYLRENLLEKHPSLAKKVPLRDWIYRPGIPASAPRTVSTRLMQVEQKAVLFCRNEKTLNELDASGWGTREWRRFLGILPLDLGRDKMQSLDEAFHLSQSGNIEILDRWLRMALRSRYEPAYSRVVELLLSVGRKRYLKPLYEEMTRMPEGNEWARQIYIQARPRYHPITRTTLDKLLRYPG